MRCLPARKPAQETLLIGSGHSGFTSPIVLARNLPWRPQKDCSVLPSSASDGLPCPLAALPRSCQRPTIPKPLICTRKSRLAPHNRKNVATNSPPQTQTLSLRYFEIFQKTPPHHRHGLALRTKIWDTHTPPPCTVVRYGTGRFGRMFMLWQKLGQAIEYQIYSGNLAAGYPTASSFQPKCVPSFTASHFSFQHWTWIY